MMSVEKRLTLVLFLVMIIGGSVFAQERIGGGNTPARDFSMSAGGRIFYNGMFDIWEANGTAPDSVFSNLYSNNGFGIGGFFDATYVEIGMDFIFGSFKPNHDSYTGDFELQSTQFGFTILGKFPIAADPITFFPLAGIDYQIFLSGESEGSTIERDDLPGDYEDMFDAFSLVVGAGLDYSITSKLYLRGEVLINFKMEGNSDKAIKRLIKEYGTFSLFTFGPRVSVGVGYRFPAKGAK